MPTIDDSQIERLLEEYSSQGRTALLPALHAVQDHFGYIPKDVAERIGHALNLPLAEIYGVIEFYTLFYDRPVGKTVLHVCGDPACSMAGSGSIFKDFRRGLTKEGDASLSDQEITILRASCLGLCEKAPAVLVHGNLLDGDLRPLDKEALPNTNVFGVERRLTRNCGRGRSTFLNEYRSSGGYQTLQKTLRQPPEEMIEIVKESGLVGRGGAAFPTGLKWESAAKSLDPVRYLICNADEAEPGTFKDRILMEDDPHQLLEGMILAAYAIQAHKAYIYIRGEYNHARKIVQHALDEAIQEGLVGSNIADSGFSLEIEIRQGAGAYVCGEETALFESIEGKRGYPRSKPPFPTTYGLFGKPTVINNVETLSNIPVILRMGAPSYRQIGTEKSPGTKLFCLSGDISHPGLYEMPFGVSARQLIFEYAGGIPGGHSFQAALIGGAAGAFLPSWQLDVPLSFEGLRAAGLPLGSGVITVLNETRDLIDVLLRLGHFFAEESCGKCYPCQIGTYRQYEILKRIAQHGAQDSDTRLLQEIGATMTDASLCGLGQTAASAILSAIKNWPHLFSSIH